MGSISSQIATYGIQNICTILYSHPDLIQVGVDLWNPNCDAVGHDCVGLSKARQLHTAWLGCFNLTQFYLALKIFHQIACYSGAQE